MKFFVGQRVRLARAAQPKNEGLTGRIRELWPKDLRGGNGIDLNCSVDWDNGDRDVSFAHPYNGEATDRSRLEPILPEGHKPCEVDFKRDLDRLLEREGVSA